MVKLYLRKLKPDCANEFKITYDYNLHTEVPKIFKTGTDTIIIRDTKEVREFIAKLVDLLPAGMDGKSFFECLYKCTNENRFSSSWDGRVYNVRIKYYDAEGKDYFVSALKDKNSDLILEVS